MSHIFPPRGKTFAVSSVSALPEMANSPIYGIEAPSLIFFWGLEPVLLMQGYGSFHGRQCNHPRRETTHEAVYAC